MAVDAGGHVLIRARCWCPFVLLGALAAQDPAASAREPDLEAIAKALDPGPVAPLQELLPAWIRRALPAPPPVTEAAALFDDLWTRAWSFEGLPRDTQLQAAAAFLALESAPAGSLPAAARLQLCWICERIASLLPLLDHPVLRAPAVQGLLVALGATRAQYRELAAAAAGLADRADRLRRRHAAELLRQELTGPQRVQLLARLAGTACLPPATGRECAEAAARAAPAEAGTWVRLAHARRRADDLPGAQAALDHALQVLADRPAMASLPLERLLEDAAAARQARAQQAQLQALAALALPADADACTRGLAAATRLELVGEEQAADASYERLCKDHQDDARPWVARARRAYTAGDLALARQQLAAAERLRPHETAFHLLRLILELTPDAADRTAPEPEPEQVLARMQDGIKEIARTEPAWAEVLRLLLASGVPTPRALEHPERVLARCGELYPTAEQGYRQHHSLPAWRLMAAWSLFCPQRSRALRALQQPLPEGHDDEDARLRAQNWLALALGDGEPPPATDLQPLLADLERIQLLPFDAGLLRGTQAALQARRAGAAANWGDAVRALQAAVPPLGHPRLALALNNLGLALHESGAQAQALAAWERALGAGDPERVAMCNMVIAVAGGDDAETAALARHRLGELAAEQRLSPGLRAHAATWLGWLADRAGDGAAARTAWQQAVQVLDGSRYTNPRMPGVADGVLPSGEWYWSLSISAGGELRLTNRATADLWLTLPPPLTEQQVRQRASAKATR